MENNLYAKEAKEKWGTTDAYKESQRRLKNYSAEDIELAKKQAAEAELMFLDALLAGAEPDSELAAQAAEAHRQAISDWWYECDYEMQTGLAQMYLVDERFSNHYNARHPELAKFVHDAILANAISKI